MYAICEIQGKQYKVEAKSSIFVDKIEGNEGDKVEIDKVLLVDNDGKVSVGQPTVSGAKVSAKIEEQVKGDKVLIFKKKRRKGYQKSQGHRQQYTKIAIETING